MQSWRHPCNPNIAPRQFPEYNNGSCRKRAVGIAAGNRIQIGILDSLKARIKVEKFQAGVAAAPMPTPPTVR